MISVKNRNLVLLIIVIAQFFCTSLWFASNGIMADLLAAFGLNDSATGHLTSAVQFGFIMGTLAFAITSLADRYSPSTVFFFSAVLGAIFNFGMTFAGNSLETLLLLRFLTGFFLAGIYPVGMKIAADYFEIGLGKSLGFLVGALVLGTALPHLLKDITYSVSWHMVLKITSILATTGGLLVIVLVANGPFQSASAKFAMSNSFRVFKNKEFRAAAFGYFGHMWELYAFWTFIPVILLKYSENHAFSVFSIPTASFLIIAIGSIGCIIAGLLSFKYTPKKVATVALFLSGVCCLVSPIFINQENGIILMFFLLFWGLVVIADSPLFSTLVAQNAPSQLKGTALTIVNCFGFAISIISIQLLSNFITFIDVEFLFLVLVLGPLFGLLSLLQKK